MSDTDRLVTATAKAVSALDVVDVIVDEARDWEWPLDQRAFSAWLRRLNAATRNGRSA